MIPITHIKHNKFLEPMVQAYLKTQPNWKDWAIPSDEEIETNVQRYRKAWREIEGRALTGICDIMKLDFRINIVDIHIVSGLPRAFSKPIVIRSTYPTQEFIDTLIHELIHVVLSENNNIASWEVVDYEMSLAPGESKTVYNHIPISAIMEKLYKEVLDFDQKLIERKARTRSREQAKDYAKAWDIVEKIGADVIIKEMISRYRKPS